jgi:hypothetical protein
MAAKKPLTPAQQRERRARIAAIVLGVVFIGVAAIQGPKLMSQLQGKSAAAPVAAPAQTAASAAGTQGRTSLVSAPAAAGQLERFTRFASKDPFKALVKSIDPGAAAAGASGAAGKASAGQKAAVVKGKKGSKSSATFTQTPSATAPGGPTVPAALILYNGKKKVVVLGSSFPSQQPVFRLVSLSLKTVQIGLVGGSFANGKTTMPLRRGKKITLSNSTTGKKFVLELLKLTTAPKPVVLPAALPGVGATAAGATTPTTTTAG